MFIAKPSSVSLETDIMEDEEERRRRLLILQIVVAILTVLAIVFGAYSIFESQKIQQDAADNQFNSLDYDYVKYSMNSQILASLDAQAQARIDRGGLGPFVTKNENQLSRSEILEQWKGNGVEYPISNEPSPEQGSVEIVDSANLDQIKATDTDSDIQNTSNNAAAPDETSIIEGTNNVVSEGQNNAIVDPVPVPMRQLIKVKYLMIDDSEGTKNLTISEIWNSEELISKVLGQQQSHAELFKIDGIDSYYAVYATPTVQNGIGIDIIDALAALDDYNGQAIDGVVYDKSTGLAYIPAAVVEEYGPDGIQLQFLQRVSLTDESSTMASIDTTIISSIDKYDNSIIEKQVVKADGFDSCIDIPIFNKSDVEPNLVLDNFEVYFNGIPVDVNEDTALYDDKTGHLILGYAPNGVSSISIRLKSTTSMFETLMDTVMGTEKADAYTLHDGDISFFYNGNVMFDRVTPSTFTPGAAYAYAAMMRVMPNKTEQEAAKYGKATGQWYVESDAEHVFAQRLRDGASWSEIRESAQPWHTIYGSASTIVEMEGPFDKNIGGIDWHVIGQYSPIAGDCSHITSAVGSDTGHQGGEWFNSRVFIRILRTVNAGNWSYVIFGVQSPNVKFAPLSNDYQCGSGIYKVRIASATHLDVTKTSNGSTSMGISKGSPVAGAKYGLYSDSACTNLVDTFTTNATGNAKIDIAPDTTYYMRELSVPWPHVASTEKKTVRGSSGQTVKVNLSDNTGATIQLNKSKRPQNGTYSSGTVHFPTQDSGSTVDVSAKIESRATIVEFSAKIKTDADFDGSSLVLQLPSELKYTRLLGITPNNIGANLTNRSGELTITGLRSEQEYDIRFGAEIMQGWSSSARVASILVINPKGTGLAKGTLSITLPQNTMAGAQYTVYVDPQCTIEAGDYNLKAGVAASRSYYLESPMVAKKSAQIAPSNRYPVNYNWRPLGTRNGKLLFVSTSSNLAIGSGSTKGSLTSMQEIAESQGSQWWDVQKLLDGENFLKRSDSKLALTYTSKIGIVGGWMDIEDRADSEMYLLPDKYDDIQEQSDYNSELTWLMQKTSSSSVMTVDASGNATWGNQRGQTLVPGFTYYVKETKAPVGYDIDAKIYSFVASAGSQHKINVTDTFTSIEVRKSTRYPDFCTSDDRYSIQGAKYGVYLSNPDFDPTAKPVSTITTDASGVARLDYLKENTRYYVKELTPSKGMLLDTKTYDVFCAAGSLNVVNVIEEMAVKVNISKESESYVPNVQAYSLAGAEFSFYENESDAESKNNAVATITTKEGGKSDDITLPLKDYWVRETVSPYGYEINDEVQKISHEDFFEDIRQTRTFTDVPRKITIKATKTTDPLTQDEPYFSSLAGAEFLVFETYEDALNQENPIRSVISKADGSCDLMIDFEPAEYYYLREKQQPDRYQPNDAVYTLHVTDSVDLEQDIYDDGDPVSITITKKTTDPKVLESNYSLKGAVFGVYKSEFDALNRDNPVATITSDENGNCETITGLHARKYWVSEITAPEGFWLEPDAQIIRYVDSDHVEVTFANEPHYGYVYASKRSTDEYNTPDTSPEFSYENTKFAIYDSKAKADVANAGNGWGNYLFTLTTDKTGDVKSTTPLIPGTYYMREIAAPKGYMISNATYAIEAYEENADIVVASETAPSASVIASAAATSSAPDAMISMYPMSDTLVIPSESASFKKTRTLSSNASTVPTGANLIEQVSNITDPPSSVRNDIVEQEAVTLSENTLTDSYGIPIGGDLTEAYMSANNAVYGAFKSLLGSDEPDSEYEFDIKDFDLGSYTIDYTISYDLNGGTARSIDSQHATFDTDNTTEFNIAFEKPTKVGFEFEGWATRIPERVFFSPLILFPGEKIVNFVVDTEQNESEWGYLDRTLNSFANSNDEIQLVAIWKDEEGNIDAGDVKLDKTLPITASSTTYATLYRYNKGNYTYLTKSSTDNWCGQTVMGKVPTSSGTPVYQLKNPNSDEYHYTTSTEERDNLVNATWKLNGISFYSDDAEANGVRRLYASDVGNWFGYESSKTGLADLGIKFYVLGFYNISFAKGATSGVTGTMNSMTNLQYGINYTLTNNAFTRTGYTFNGWKSSKNNQTYSNKATVSSLDKSSATGSYPTVTMTAQWKANTYTVNYDGNGNTGGSSAATVHTYDAAKNLSSGGFTKTGYKLKNWNTEKNGTGTTYALGQSVTNLRTSGSMTLYAQWEPIKYTIKYDKYATGATGSMTSSTPLVDTDFTLPACSFGAPPNCSFVGWSLTKPQGNVRVLKKNYNDKAVVKFAESYWSTNQTKEITLYAVWKSNIKIDPNATTVYNSPEKTTLQIQKRISGELPSGVDATQYSLKGAIFGIYANQTNASNGTLNTTNLEVARITTDAGGSACFDNVTVGSTYYVKELKAPDNGYFAVNNTVFPISIKANTPSVVTVDETIIPQSTQVPLKIVKKISNSNQATYLTDYGRWNVQGTSFGVYKSKDDAVADANMVTELIVNEDGEATATLFPATYWVAERTSANGLDLKKTPKEVELVAGSTIQTNTVEFANEAESISIEVEKINANPNMTAAHPDDYRLSGAVFGVFESEQDAKNLTNEVAQMITGDDGKAKVEGLFPKHYYIIEKTAPKNFEASTRVYQISPDVTTTQIVKVENSPIVAQIAIVKTSDLDNLGSRGDVLISGAEFGIYSDMLCLNEVSTTITDDNGIAPTVNLAPGKYYVKEKTAPKGHSLIEEVREVELTGATLITETFENHALRGSIFVSKTSNHSDWLNNDLSGAAFAVYADEGLENQVAMIKTGSDGTGRIDDIPVGTYYVKEVTALKGHSIDENAYEVNVSDGTTAHVANKDIENITTSLAIHKTPSIDALENMTVEGAIYGVYRSDRCLENDLITRLVTNENGYTNEAVLMECGTYYVREELAPRGYRLDTEIHEIALDKANDEVTLELMEDIAAAPTQIIIRKASSETGVTTDNGPHDTAGAVFSIEFYDQDFIEKIDLDDVEPTRTWKVKTNEDGIVALTDASLLSGSDELYKDKDGNIMMPVGSLVVREVSAPNNMNIGLAGGSVPAYFYHVVDHAIVDEFSTVFVEELDITVDDDPVRADLFFKKVDSTGKPLANIPFALSLLDEYGNTTETHVIVTDENGEFSSVVNTHNEDGSEVPMNDNDRLLYIFDEVSNDSVIEEGFMPALNDALGIEKMKTYYEPFEDALDADFPINIRETTHIEIPNVELLNSDSGVWFCGSDLRSGTPANGRGALIYGKYRLQEISCDNNDIYLLPKPQEFTIDSEGVNVVLDDIVNIASIVSETKVHDIATASNFASSYPTTFVDEVHYEDLEPGVEYMLTGTICDVDTGDAIANESGDPLGSRLIFTTLDTDGTEYMKYDTEGFDLTGKTLSIKLQLESDYKVKNEHNVTLTDTLETLYVTDISTNATDMVTGKHYGCTSASDTVAIQDAVSYKNLEPGARYILEARLHSSIVTEDGIVDTGEIKDADGNAIVIEHTFKPEAKDSTENVTIEVDPSILSDIERVTVFEKLYRITSYEDADELMKVEIAAHEDINDEDQTIAYPKLKTQAFDGENQDSKILTIDNDTASIIDHVSWEHLPTSQSYTLKGSLVDAETGEAIYDNDDQPIEIEKAIDAGNLERKTIVRFDDIPVSDYIGHSITVVELLYDEHGNLVADHNLPGDANQTVGILDMTTNATDAFTKIEIGYANEGEGDVVIRDVVDLKEIALGMDDNEEIELIATLRDKETGKPITSNGLGTGVEVLDAPSAITASITEKVSDIVAGEPVVNVITVPASVVIDRNVVVFERAYVNGKLVAVHENLTDIEQTVSYPSIDTFAGGYDSTPMRKDGADDLLDVGKDVPANTYGYLYDDITFTNLPMNRDYEVVTWFVDRNTGEPLLDYTGHEVFVIHSLPTDSMETYRSRIDEVCLYDLHGTDIVCFEEIYADLDDGTKVLVASHKQLKDEDQFVDLVYPTDWTTLPSTGADGMNFLPLVIAFALSMLSFGIWEARRNHKRARDSVDEK